MFTKKQETVIKNIVDSVVKEIKEKWTTDYVESFISCDEDELIRFHSTLGRWIRNEFELWNENNILTKPWVKDRKSNSNIYLEDGLDSHPNHPDQVSFEIIKRIWKKLKG